VFSDTSMVNMFLRHRLSKHPAPRNMKKKPNPP